jgi:rubrerythrin
MVERLPTFEGYTVDERLGEFRKVDRTKPSIEFIRFDSAEGKKLLEKYRCCQDFCNKLDELIFDEEDATQEYKEIGNIVRKHGEDKISIIFDMLSQDEDKHAKSLKKLSMLVCNKEDNYG